MGPDSSPWAPGGRTAPPTPKMPASAGPPAAYIGLMDSESLLPGWSSRALRLAAACDVLVGGLLVVAPGAPLSWAGLEPPALPEVWQALGLVVALHGLGHALAARQPVRHWPMILIGLLVKVLVPVGFAWAAARGRLPWEAGLLVLVYGPVWWVPFGLILRGTGRARRADKTPPVVPLDMALSLYMDERGTDLLEASKHQPQFLVFLRHFGCTFCREALADLGTINERLRNAGTRLVLVHMSSEHEARELFDQHGLQEVTAISDPDRVLYRAFALRRGSPTQLLGWSVWKRGWDAGVKQGHGVGWLRGDAAQLPGAFVVSNGHVVAQFVHQSAADRPDYVVLAEQGAEQAEFQASLEEDGIGFGFQDRLRQALSSEASEQA